MQKAYNPLLACSLWKGQLPLEAVYPGRRIPFIRIQAASLHFFPFYKKSTKVWVLYKQAYFSPPLCIKRQV